MTMKFDIKKVAHAILFFQQKGVQSLAKTKLMKLMFYADKYHLQAYMRPVFQDVYFKLPHGPVPTLTLNVINSVNEMENDDLEELVDAFLSVVSVEEKYAAQYRTTVFSSNGVAFDPRLFSRSELQVLEQVANEFKTITAKAISEKSHLEPEYESSEMNAEIKYGLMAPSSADFIQFIASEQAELNQAIKVTH